MNGTLSLNNQWRNEHLFGLNFSYSFLYETLYYDYLNNIYMMEKG